jgi:hypothetical protein
VQNDVEQLGGKWSHNPNLSNLSKTKENKESVMEGREGIIIHFSGMGC